MAAATPARSSASGAAAAIDGCTWSVADSTGEGVAATACSGAPLAPSPATDSDGGGAANTLAVRVEQSPPRRIDSLGVVSVLLEKLADVAGVETGRLESGARFLAHALVSTDRCR